MDKKYIIAPVVIGAITVSGYTAVKIDMLETENASLKNELANKKEKPKDYSVSVEKISEINQNNTNLIVYESDFTDYELGVVDNSLFGINATIKAKFKMIVTVDLSKAEITKSDDMIIVHVDPSTIVLKEVCVSKPDITYDTNIITNLRGKTIQELEKDLLVRTYDDIDRTVKREFKLNEELYKMNLVEKLNRIYNCDNVKVTFK